MSARPIEITDADDERIVAFRSIREKDLVGRRGLFIAEGTVVLRLLAEAHRQQTRFCAEAILVLENRLNGVLDILAGFPDDVPVYTCPSAVMNAIAGFDMHRGVLALGRTVSRPSARELATQLPGNALVVVCVGLSNHDNAGGIFRNATAFGADAVLLDETSCDPLYRKAIRVSVGSVLKMPWSRGGQARETLQALKDEGFRIVTLSPSGTIPLNEVSGDGRIALVLGTEGEGLPADILSAFEAVRIPQSAGLDSLNVSVAAGVALYQLAVSSGRIS